MCLHSENPIFYSLSLREVGWPAGPVSVSALSHFNATNVCRFPPFCEYLHEEAEEGARYSAGRGWPADDGHRQMSPHIINFSAETSSIHTCLYMMSSCEALPYNIKWYSPLQANDDQSPNPLPIVLALLQPLLSLVDLQPRPKTSGWISPPTHPPYYMHDQHPPSGKVILLSRLKRGLLLTISLATVSFKLSMFLHTSLCNKSLHLFFACHSIIMSAYCTFPTIYQIITIVPKMYASLCPNCVTKPPWCNKKNYQMFLSIATPMTKLLSLSIKLLCIISFFCVRRTVFFYMSNMIICLLLLPLCKDLIFMPRYSSSPFQVLWLGERSQSLGEKLYSIYLRICLFLLNSCNISISFSSDGAAKTPRLFAPRAI